MSTEFDRFLDEMENRDNFPCLPYFTEEVSTPLIEDNDILLNDNGPMSLNELRDDMEYYSEMDDYPDFPIDIQDTYYEEIDDEYGILNFVRDLNADFIAVDEPDVLESIVLYTVDPVSSLSVSKPSESLSFECAICMEEHDVSSRVTPTCNHEYCKDCMIQHLNMFRNNGQKATCAYCRQDYICIEILDKNALEEVADYINNV